MGRRDTKHFPSQTAEIITNLAEWVIRTGSPLIWIGRSWQAGEPEHGTGRAVDLILSTHVGMLPTPEQKRAGDQLVAWLIKHADALHVRHIIWQNKIWKRRYREQGWRPLPTPRRTITDKHLDHVHVYLDDAAGYVPSDPITSTTTEGDDDMPLTQDDLNKIAKVINHNIWETHLPNAGTFAEAMSDLAVRGRTIAQSTAAVHRGGDRIPLNQEVADAKTLAMAQAERIDELEAKIDRILDLLTPDRAAE
ncbi:MAG: hypothetical protein Q4D96_02855 [Propionibacteriaceae bacterium]|nr:hypothetical protein [Propionibacteriaceae bacterium]